ncbi:MAG TPA: hypothetical protein VEY51_04155 [Chondromyces sp.]|nr:hypothetical protein [Chondromyces sp.]
MNIGCAEINQWKRTVCLKPDSTGPPMSGPKVRTGRKSGITGWSIDSEATLRAQQCHTADIVDDKVKRL